jgi:hypothetical protein
MNWFFKIPFVYNHPPHIKFITTLDRRDIDEPEGLFLQIDLYQLGSGTALPHNAKTNS